MEESEHLRNLENIIPKLSNLITNNYGETVQYESENGPILGFGLFNEKKISMQRVFFSKGSKFQTHQHNELEYIMVYDGKIEVYCVDENNIYCIQNSVAKDKMTPIILSPGDCAFFPSFTPHNVSGLEDSWAIVTTIPAGEGFPDV